MTNDCPGPGTLPRGRRSVALRPRARTLHPHLGTTLWMAGSGAVDERPRNRGQPVDGSGTTRVGSGLSTAAATCPRARPHRHPHAPPPRPPPTGRHATGAAPTVSIHTIHSPCLYCWISPSLQEEEEQGGGWIGN